MGNAFAYNEKGQPFSKWKPAERFAYLYELEGGGTPEREYRFDAERKWRFDFAFPAERIAVEIDGFGYGHQAVDRLTQNHEKQNAAVEDGWIVLCYTSKQLGSRQGVSDAVAQVDRLRELCQYERVR